MESIPVENIILEDELKQGDELNQEEDELTPEEDELTPEEQAFYKEIKNMELELDKMNKQRKQYIESIREKIRNNVKNGEDAIGYLPRYIKYTIDFDYYQFEDIDGEHTLWISPYDSFNNSQYDKINKLAEELCGNYLNIQIEGNDTGCIITYSEKK
jgi:hypothetical protein